ncbi:MAG: SPL family radical SAM protein [Planctomycetota bacterium]|jgi:DNA repair photolyase
MPRAVADLQQQCLWTDRQSALPAGYEPLRPDRFEVDRIYLAKGSLATPERARFVQRICALYPDAERIECSGTPHNRIDLGVADPLARHGLGKRTLVFGEHKSAVRKSDEEGNTCPNYWHFSPYDFCFYGCRYCYLAGTAGVWFSPTVKIYVNLPEIVREIDRVANRLADPTAFYVGKLQDGLALDPLTAYSTVLVPFFARHRYARQVILTKSADVERLVGLGHRGCTTLSWSLLPPEVAPRFEVNVPPVEARIDAMKRCADAGYPVRAVLMPLVPVDGWESIYLRFVARLLAEVPIRRLTLGGICSYRNARGLMERKLGRSNTVSVNFERNGGCGDGRVRYPPDLRARMYGALVEAARSARPDVELALCLEERPVWEALGIEEQMGRCNCVL